MIARNLGSVLVSVALAGAALSACSGPGAGKSTFTAGDVEGTPSTDDPGSDDDTTTSDPVFGTAPFAYVSPGQNARDVAAHATEAPLEGSDCLKSGCHSNTGPKWGFAGTVFTSTTATTTVAEAEVGVVYADNTVKTAMTDANGNFWLEEEAYPPARAKIGVRKAGGATKMMGLTLPAGAAGGSCNSANCHGSTSLRIFVN